MEREESLVQQVKVINEKHETIKRINGENFNIFSILKLEKKEVDTHSYFIYDLLNPKGSHNQGDKFLQIFLKQILKKKEYKKIGSIIEDKVEREKIITNSKRIDLTIETSNFFIAIEMKIDAHDQDEQLYDYYEYSKKKGKDFKLFYLTLDGKEAGEKSIKGLEVDENYFLLSFQYDIYNWIEACIEKTATIPTIREGLVHYRNLIQKLTNQMGDEMSKDIESIIKTPSDMEAMHNLYNEYTNVLARKEAEFWESLYDKIENKNSGFQVVYLDVDSNLINDKIDYKYIAKKRKERNHNFFGLSMSKIIESFEIECEIYLKDKENSLIMNFQISKNNKEIKLAIVEQQLIKIGFVEEFKDYSRYFHLKEKIKFYGNGEPTFELFDTNKFNKLIEDSAEEVNIILEKILKNEKELFSILSQNITT